MRKTIAEIKTFVNGHDQSGKIEYTFGEAFDMPEEEINGVAREILVPMARIRYRFFGGKIGSIGIAIRILEEVLGLVEYSSESLLQHPSYTPEQVIKLAIALQQLDGFAREQFLQNFSKNLERQRAQPAENAPKPGEEGTKRVKGTRKHPTKESR